MKITSFSPLIATSNGAELQKMFEELGFVERHRKTSGVDPSIYTAVLEDGEGNVVNFSNVRQMPKDMTIVRMNVDNLEEACEIMKAHGFNPMEGTAGVTGSSQSVLMVSKSGFAVDVVKHIKD